MPLNRRSLVRRAVLAGATAAPIGFAGAAVARADDAIDGYLLRSPSLDEHNRVVPASPSVLPLSISAPPGHARNLTEWGPDR